MKITEWKSTARKALRGALEVRKRAGVNLIDPICVYDLAEKLNLEVKFLGGSSFGGMYSKNSKTIIVPALRPKGRQAFTCAHEIGHWFFDHGTRIDDLIESNSFKNTNKDEFLANLFAGYLLMTPWAIKEAFEKRNCLYNSCESIQFYKIANQFGVGFETLIQHLRWSLELTNDAQTERLLKLTPKQIRKSLLNDSNSTDDLIVVDMKWTKVPIDLQVGDIAIIPNGAIIEGRSAILGEKNEFGLIIHAKAPGISRATLTEEWAAFIRVSKKNFEGRSIYRHLEDYDVD